MIEVALYLEVKAMARDENGNPAPAGVKMTVGEAKEAIDYGKLAAAVDLEVVARYLTMFDARPEDITIITPEEYAERYGISNPAIVPDDHTDTVYIPKTREPATITFTLYIRKMSRKRFVKKLMANGVPRNLANFTADVCRNHGHTYAWGYSVINFAGFLPLIND